MSDEPKGFAPAASTVEEELKAEQAYLDVAYGRLDEMRQAAIRVAEGYADVQRGGTHQARLERDAAAAHTRRRLAALDIGDNPLCFGRLDLKASGVRASGTLEQEAPYYVGRISVTDDEQTPLVVDWRAPVAEPFYRATAVEPMGVVRRRHFHTRAGRELVGIDDEVLDPMAVTEAGYTILGEGSLLSEVLERQRTGRMPDIVATIQSEQDEAIRADLAGVLIVAGGPGTGKTAVALHRAAYLLYTHRRRLQARGVLLVGPNPIFLRYIDQVLPSLGEDDVQLTTPTRLKPQLGVSADETPAVAAVKGDARMADVVAAALRDRERKLPRDLIVTLDGLRIKLRTSDSARIVERARRRRGTHNERRPYVTRLTLDHLRAQYRRALVRAYREGSGDRGEELDGSIEVPVAAALARGEPAPQEWEDDLTARLRRLSDVRAALDRMWPVLNGAELIHDLFSFEALIRSAADGTLTPDEQRGLFRARAENVRQVAWTDADVALVDEADALLGPVEAARPRRRRRRSPEEREQLASAARMVEELGLGGYMTAADVAQRYGGTTGSGDDDGDSHLRTFGHVIVDEAQDLTAMQWRMLARRCPSGSMTIVGDLGQASRPGALEDWDAITAQLPAPRSPRHVTLTVNYRTPAEIMTVANRVLAAAAASVDPVQSVRTTGRTPRFVTAAPDELANVAAQAARDASDEAGTIALIAPSDLHGALVAQLADLGAVAGTTEALDAPVAVLTPLNAKGLEFDHVVVVEPSRLVTADSYGLRLLYVTLTRATRTLTVVHADPLPEALVE